jgi:hypothetical protein
LTRKTAKPMVKTVQRGYKLKIACRFIPSNQRLILHSPLINLNNLLRISVYA